MDDSADRKNNQQYQNQGRNQDQGSSSMPLHTDNQESDPMDVDPQPDTNTSTPENTGVITAQPSRVQHQHPDQHQIQHPETNQHSPGQNQNPEVTEGQKQHPDMEDLGHLTDNNAVKPSAPLDVAWFLVKVDWKEELPPRWNHHLQTALQSWCNSELKEKCSIESFVGNERTAQVSITPSTALKDINSAEIKLKQLKETITVHFQHIQDPTAQTMDVDSGSKGQKRSAADGDSQVPVTSAAATDKNQSEPMKDAGAAPGHTEMIGTSDALTVPPFQYWYLSQAYCKEVEKIQNEFGVKITAETRISISPEKTSEKSENDVINARQAFTALFQDKTKKLTFVPIPQTHMESDVMKNVLQNIPNEKHKLMLNMSANNHLLIGPEEMTSGVAKRLHLEPGVEATTSAISGTSGRRSLDMNITDIAAVIEMDEAHAKLLEVAFVKEISEIENKYGVCFSSVPGQGTIKVSIHSRGTHQINLEAHAFRAFTHLYQKVVTSAITCGLKDDSYTEQVSQELERIRPKHPCVGGGERNGSWKLLGFPRHLIPAIVDIEKNIGVPVFDREAMKLLGHPWNFPQASGLRRGNVGMKMMSGAHGSDLRDGTEFQDKGKVNGNDKDEDCCSICLYPFTKKAKLICGHEFCEECLQMSIKTGGKICPLCKKIFGILKGNQPPGTMSVQQRKYSKLPGFPHCGTIVIEYVIPSGIQTDEHPNPGKHYSGAQRTAYLPDNNEGNHVLKLLRRAFDQRLVFTVGLSRTSGADNTVIWNDIHHKTNTDGGPEHYGYPDPDYLKRVKEELKAKGIE